MDDPTDQPAQQADPHCHDHAVRLDLGGWISGPCLDADKLLPPAGWLTEPNETWPEDRRQRTAQ